MASYQRANGTLLMDVGLAELVARAWVEEWTHTPVKEMSRETGERGFIGTVLLAVLGDRAQLRKDARNFAGRFDRHYFGFTREGTAWRQLNDALQQSDRLGEK